MPRSRRIVVPGLPHHITQRGNRRMNVFLDVADRRVFLRILREVSLLYSLQHYSYSLMTNHFHLISSPEEAPSLSLTIRDVLGPDAAYFNHKYGFSGRLWRGRFYSTVLDETHFWAALRHVERNPVRAGMVIRAEEYEWSAAATHCSLKHDRLLTALPGIPDFIGDWSTWIAGEDDLQEIKIIRRTTKTGRPCGSSGFVEELEGILGVKLRAHKPDRHKSKSAPTETLPFFR